MAANSEEKDGKRSAAAAAAARCQRQKEEKEEVKEEGRMEKEEGSPPVDGRPLVRVRTMRPTSKMTNDFECRFMHGCFSKS